jgi:hypothetical protein
LIGGASEKGATQKFKINLFPGTEEDSGGGRVSLSSPTDVLTFDIGKTSNAHLDDIMEGFDKESKYKKPEGDEDDLLSLMDQTHSL